METIKTAVVVVLLLAVLYGVYVVLNKQDLTPPSDVDTWNETATLPQVDTGMPSSLDSLRRCRWTNKTLNRARQRWQP